MRCALRLTGAMGAGGRSEAPAMRPVDGVLSTLLRTLVLVMTIPLYMSRALVRAFAPRRAVR